jgi:hypothetical protein
MYLQRAFQLQHVGHISQRRIGGMSDINGGGNATEVSELSKRRYPSFPILQSLLFSRYTFVA